MKNYYNLTERERLYYDNLTYAYGMTLLIFISIITDSLRGGVDDRYLFLAVSIVAVFCIGRGKKAIQKKS